MVPVTFIRPYEEDIRVVVARAVERAGGKVARVFRPPLRFLEISDYLAGEGRDDRLVIPFFRSKEESGVDIVRRYHVLAGVRRQILMPTKYALRHVVVAALQTALGIAHTQVLVVPVTEIERDIEAIRLHFAAPGAHARRVP